jgi:hypothetical protein
MALTAVFYVRRLRSDLDTYVMPRVVTAKQADELRDFLSLHAACSVTVKVNPLDEEALEYWAQLSNALKRTEWNVEMSTASADPNTQNPGLNIYEQGINAKPKDPKADLRALLEQAFQAAHIAVNGSGGAAAGEYKLFILVGRRPRVIHSPSFKTQIGQWIIRRVKAAL